MDTPTFNGRYADTDEPLTDRPRGLDALIPTAPDLAATEERALKRYDGYDGPREPETVAEALADVHRRCCPSGRWYCTEDELEKSAPCCTACVWADPEPERHDPVCRILSVHVANLEAALEASRKSEPTAPAGTTDGDRDGVTFTPEFDRDRLNRQAGDVYDTLAGKYDGSATWDGAPRWWTLRELAEFTGHPEASVSARIRDLRKPRFGGLTIERRRRGEGRGTWEYRLEVTP